MSPSPTGPSIQQFHQRAKATQGAFRMGADNKLEFTRYRGAFLGKAVRWLRTKLRSSGRNAQYQAASVKAAKAFAKSLRAYYGAQAANTALAGHTLKKSRPFQAQDVRDIIKKTHAQQQTTLKRIIKTSRKNPDDGYGFLKRLAKYDMLDSEMIQKNLAKSWFEPSHSALETARSLIVDQGLQIPKAKMLAVHDAVMQARQDGDAQKFYHNLAQAGALKDPQIMTLFSRMPMGFDIKSHGFDCAALYRLVAGGFFIPLQSALPAQLEKTKAGTALLYRTPPLNEAARKHYEHLLADVAFGDDPISIQDEHVTAHIDKDTGQFDAKAFFEALPNRAQFKKDFLRDISTFKQYEIDGKNYVDKPDEALQALWAASSGNPSIFRASCNLLTQTTLNAFYDNDVVDKATGRYKTNGQGYDASRFVFSGMSPDRNCVLTSKADGGVDITLGSHASLKNGRLLGMLHDIAPQDAQVLQLDFDLSEGAEFTRQTAVALEVSPDGLLARQADIFCTFDGPVTGFSPAENRLSP